MCERERRVGEREIASMFYIVRLKVFFILFPNIISGFFRDLKSFKYKKLIIFKLQVLSTLCKLLFLWRDCS